MEGVSREAQMSIVASSVFPGFRFSPTDEELISFYLRKKVEGSEKSVEIISQIELCRHEPWDLPAKSIIQSESEWFFFSPRGRKYPNGSQSRRATELGYWKATGKERNVKSNSIVIGTKRTLVYHIGRAPKGERTEWIMHEYCMIGRAQDSLVVCRLRKNSEFRLNDPAKPDSPARRSITLDSGSVGSQNIEQIDSTSESNLKTVADVGQSSGHQRDENDDFYADILKDDIIDLDDVSIPARPDLIPLNHNLLEADEISHQPRRDFVTDPFPPQGNANRRLRLEKDTRRFYDEAFEAINPIENSDNKSTGVESEIGKSEMSAICIMCTNVSSSRMINRLVRVAFFVVLILLAWSLSSLRSSWVAMKRILLKPLSQGGWH